MKITIFNVKYSPNLGDGVIAECLEHQLGEQLPRADIHSLDLAGRTGWQAGTARNKLWKLALLQSLPRRVAELAVGAVLQRTLKRKMRPVWRARLASTDAAIIGGGQLIQDVDLNFPLKLDAVLHECRAACVPISIFAVGAAKSRSEKGRQIFSDLFRSTSVKSVAVRDEDSQNAVEDLCCRSSQICRDPGLLASRVWPKQPVPNRRRRVVGLGITNPTVIEHHGSTDRSRSGSPIISLYQRAALDLATAGYDVICFTNGAPEDELTRTQLCRDIGRASVGAGSITFVQRPATPRQLAELIASCDAVVSHRLHASIVAYSYRVAHIGLTWDSKVLSFFNSVGRSEFVHDLNDRTVASLARLVDHAIETGVCRWQHARVLDETADGIRALAAVISREPSDSIADIEPPRLPADRRERPLRAGANA